jgi:hypothetical protein
VFEILEFFLVDPVTLFFNKQRNFMQNEATNTGKDSVRYLAITSG